MLLELVEEALEELTDLDPKELLDKSVLNIAPEKPLAELDLEE